MALFLKKNGSYYFPKQVTEYVARVPITTTTHEKWWEKKASNAVAKFLSFAMVQLALTVYFL